LENIPRDQPVMYASNHSSMFDIWALFATLPGSVRFLAKRELFRIPLLGRAMLAWDTSHRSLGTQERVSSVRRGGTQDSGRHVCPRLPRGNAEPHG